VVDFFSTAAIPRFTPQKTNPVFSSACAHFAQTASPLRNGATPFLFNALRTLAKTIEGVSLARLISPILFTPSVSYGGCSFLHSFALFTKSLNSSPCLSIASALFAKTLGVYQTIPVVERARCSSYTRRRTPMVLLAHHSLVLLLLYLVTSLHPCLALPLIDLTLQE